MLRTYRDKKFLNASHKYKITSPTYLLIRNFQRRLHILVNIFGGVHFGTRLRFIQTAAFQQRHAQFTLQIDAFTYDGVLLDALFLGYEPLQQGSVRTGRRLLRASGARNRHSVHIFRRPARQLRRRRRRRQRNGRRADDGGRQRLRLALLHLGDAI